MKINEENLLITDGKETQQKQSNKWIVINIYHSNGVIIFVCLWRKLARWKLPILKVYYNKILVMVGVALALYNVIRQVNEINKSQ
jgi:uncharacterized membrane protein YhhN